MRGADLFYFRITNSGVIPEGMKNYVNEFNDDCYGSGYSCTAWVIYNKNLDYLHCDDLSWDGKHSCDD